MNVSAEAHALLAVSATENRNVPDVDAVHTEMCVSVSDVPPLVHADGAELNASDAPDDEAAKVKEFRVAEPTETLAVPAAPGSPVCS
ncbi:hypothetical protein ACFRFU_19675 [Streptomyces sp. NPDC056704]|uniref:hypothetical protein n=1 Tax=Streptomyces sp. NPDC056704 TaxID=3345917 RepID=UPI0036766C2E